jgi:cysteine desulfurase
MDAEVYLDNNATTRPLPEVVDAMLGVLSEGFGNPSSAHAGGDRARSAIEHAREAVAALVGADPTKIFFTSGGTEANNLVLTSACRGHQAHRRVITTAVEHSSVLKACEYLATEGIEIAYLAVDRQGRLSLDDLESALSQGAGLVSIQWVNNETGVIQPIQAILRLCNEASVPLHTDAAQAVGKLRIDIGAVPVDFLTLTAHKFHGPQGVGAIYAKKPKLLSPLLFGGPQEGGIRAGTENVPGIVGVGRAAELRNRRLDAIQAHLIKLRDQFEGAVLSSIPKVEVNGAVENRVCNTSNLLFRDTDGQALVVQLDLRGIRCSQSSACTNRRPEPSYVLRAMGLTEDEAYASVRFSFSEQNAAEEIDYVVAELVQVVTQLRSFSKTSSLDVPKEGGIH